MSFKHEIQYKKSLILISLTFFGDISNFLPKKIINIQILEGR